MANSCDLCETCLSIRKDTREPIVINLVKNSRKMQNNYPYKYSDYIKMQKTRSYRVYGRRFPFQTFHTYLRSYTISEIVENKSSYSLPKNSKKKYDSFRDELEEYIKMQRARGLNPNICFRKEKKNSVETQRFGEIDSSQGKNIEQRSTFDTFRTHTQPYNILPVESQLPTHLKKSSHSLQDKLKDYIKVKKARELEPKTCYRRKNASTIATHKREGVHSRHENKRVEPKLPFETSQSIPRSYTISKIAEKQLSPQCLLAHDRRRRRQDSMTYSKPTRNHFSERTVPLSRSQRGNTSGSSSVEYEAYKDLSSEISTSVDQAGYEQKSQKRKSKEKVREWSEKEQSKYKRKEGNNYTVQHKSKSMEQMKKEGDKIHSGKSEHRKKNKTHSIHYTKEKSEHTKEKKMAIEKKTEEDMLWDWLFLDLLLIPKLKPKKDGEMKK